MGFDLLVKDEAISRKTEELPDVATGPGSNPGEPHQPWEFDPPLLRPRVLFSPSG